MVSKFNKLKDIFYRLKPFQVLKRRFTYCIKHSFKIMKQQVICETNYDKL